MKKVLIVGKNSYIGDSVRDYLQQYTNDYELSVLDAVDLQPKTEQFKGYDVVFHVAGIAHRKEAKENAHLYYAINRDLAIAVAEKAKEAGVGHFIIMSSMSVYGLTTGHIEKRTKPNPKNHYGKGKLQADRAIWKLHDKNFRVAVLRPPMVYGNGCKGNYQALRSFALKSPVFPDYQNSRSMLYIGNLNYFVKDVIDRQRAGLFFPQNNDYTNTSEMVKIIADCHNKNIKMTKAFNWCIELMQINVVKKVFGDLIYDKVDLVSEYRLEESIRSTERRQVDNNTPLVTILTVSHNSEKTISKTIEAVLNQSYSNIEYIIIDGASTDSTVDIARSYQEKFDTVPGRSLQIITEPDKGMYDALNKGAKLAHGELVGQTNADDWYEPDAVETMVDLYNLQHYDFAWGNIRIHKPSGITIKKAKIDPLWTTSGWCHPASFSKRDVLLDHPYILDSMYDDFNYMISLRKQGKKVVTIDHLISNFSFGGMSTQKSLDDVKKRAEARYKVYRRFRFPKVYWLHCYAIELAKYMMG